MYFNATNCENGSMSPHMIQVSSGDLSRTCWLRKTTAVVCLSGFYMSWVNRKFGTNVSRTLRSRTSWQKLKDCLIGILEINLEHRRIRAELFSENGQCLFSQSLLDFFCEFLIIITLILKDKQALSEIKCTSFLPDVGKPRASRSAMIYEKKKIIYKLR